jgi:DNA topoisomerase-1
MPASPSSRGKKAASSASSRSGKPGTAKKKPSLAAASSAPVSDHGGAALVIVESPAKAKTLKKILGDGYQIKASVGHIRDLPEKKLGVDIDKNFEPQYEVMPKKAEVVLELQTAARQAARIYLAADPDREGEAIAWHTAHLLAESMPQDRIQRVEFHEITQRAVLEAIQNPRPIDLHRVNAQQARRILDRLVGYKLSPLLWAKVTKGLSAGRVQSVAVRLVCEREAEIVAFLPVEYWTLHANLAPKPLATPPQAFRAELVKLRGEKVNLTNEADTNAVVDTLQQSAFTVSSVGDRESKRNPSPPFITSTLQREASSRFGYPVKKTMQIAQKLYEGLDLGPFGTVGLITYMRTDSTRISDEAQAEAKQYILSQFGAPYYPDTPRVYTKKGKNVQDAHEAIRPTAIHRTPEQVRPFLTDEQLKIYRVVWERFVSSQMASAQVTTRSVEVTAGPAVFRASHARVLFPGYLAVYEATESDDPDHADTSHQGQGVNISGNVLYQLNKGDDIACLQLDPKQHFTEPPPRYNEASLVKTMEELGIGRPSTYAATISTIQDRGYVVKQDRALAPTELGKTVNGLLVDHFKDIVDVHFTAQMENQLDEIAENHLPWQGVIRAFYEPFAQTLKQANTQMAKVQVVMEGENCPDCGKPMAIKNSRWGSQFLGCTGYPECKSTKPLTKDQKPAPPDRPSDEQCEKCGKPMVIRTGRFGEYLTCEDKACKNNKPLIVKTGVTCPTCHDHELIQRKSRQGRTFYGCQGYPACTFTLPNKPTGQACPECQSLLVEKILKRGTFHACSAKTCGFTREVDVAAAAAAG